MFAIGNDELARNKPIGKTIKCRSCGEEHEVRYGEEVLKNGTKVKSTLLAFYSCSGGTFLAGINGREV